MTPSGHRDSFGGDENVLEIVMMVVLPCEYMENH